MRKLSATFLILTLLSMNSGCATLVGGGGTQKVDIQSEPSGAEVFVNGVGIGKAPVSTTLEREDTHQIKFKKEGYAEEIRMTHKRTNGWIWGNLIIGGIIGILIDIATGAAYKVDPNNIYVVMSKVKSAPVEVPIKQDGAQGVVKNIIVSQPTAIDQIEKLGALKNSGLVTQEEFEIKKAELLAIPAGKVTPRPSPQAGTGSSVVKLPPQNQISSQPKPAAEVLVEKTKNVDVSSPVSSASSSKDAVSSAASPATSDPLKKAPVSNIPAPQK